jgi:hypothetical protein
MRGTTGKKEGTPAVTIFSERGIMREQPGLGSSPKDAHGYKLANFP